MAANPPPGPDPEQLASLVSDLNDALAPLGVTATARRRTLQIDITLTGPQAPEQSAVIPLVLGVLANQTLPGVEQARVFGQATGADLLSWSQIVALDASLPLQQDPRRPAPRHPRHRPNPVPSAAAAWGWI